MGVLNFYTEEQIRRSLCNLKQHNRGRVAASVEAPEAVDPITAV